MNKKELKRRLTSIICTIIYLCSSTYIWFNHTNIRTNALEKSNYFNQTYLSLEEISNNNILENAYPISDEEGLNQQGFTFKISNSKKDKITYKLEFITDDNNTLDNKYIKYSYNVNGGNYIEPKNLNEESLIIVETVDSMSSNIYNLKIWIDYNATNEIMNKTFSSKIGVQAV